MTTEDFNCRELSSADLRKILEDKVIELSQGVVDPTQDLYTSLIEAGNSVVGKVVEGFDKRRDFFNRINYSSNRREVLNEILDLSQVSYVASGVRF